MLSPWLTGPFLVPSVPASLWLQYGARREMTRRNENEPEERSSTSAAMSVLGTSGPVNTNDVLRDAG